MAVIWHGLRDGLLMAWEVWWALVLGFAISAIVQTWVPRQRIESALAGSGPKPVALATGLGAASSSCSYAAIAIAKSLFSKGASAASGVPGAGCVDGGADCRPGSRGVSDIRRVLSLSACDGCGELPLCLGA